MINQAKEGLEDILRHNDEMRRTKERGEYLQHQEEAWRENKRIKKSQEEAEERKKQSEIDACMNKGQQFPEDQQVAKPQWNTQNNKNVSIRHENISRFFLIPRPHRHQITRQKHHWMAHMIQGNNQPST